MTDMPRPRPPHLQREKNRHGNYVWVVRFGRGPRTRIKYEYGTPEFDAAYQAAINGEPAPEPGKASAGSLEWLYERYRETTAWAELSPATQRQRENILGHVMTAAGTVPYQSVNRASVVAGRDKRSSTPAQARNFLDAMRGLFRWALESEYVKIDPTAGVKNPKRPKTQGFKVWTEDQVSAYEAHWPIGTRQRVWMAVLLYSGLRRGDAVQLGRQHVRNGIATMRLEKGSEMVVVTIPILPQLAEVLAAGPCGDLTFIAGARGNPLVKESFGNLFKDACRAAGVDEDKKAAHGLRKVGATRAAENGATVAELEAIFGWAGGQMAALYTKAANRAKLSKRAMGKLSKAPDEGAGEAENSQTISKTKNART